MAHEDEDDMSLFRPTILANCNPITPFQFRFHVKTFKLQLNSSFAFNSNVLQKILFTLIYLIIVYLECIDY